MARLIVTVPTRIPATAHAELHLLGSKRRTRLPFTAPTAVYDNLAGNWVEVPRPGLAPLNKWVGWHLHTLQISVTIAAPDGGTRDPGGTVQQIVDELIDAANDDSPTRPVVFTWGRLSSSERLTHTGHWHIDSMTITGTWMQPGTNNLSQATASITLKEASDEP